MSDCCHASTPEQDTPGSGKGSATCPECGQPGRAVPVRLLKHQLLAGRHEALQPDEAWWFCAGEGCSTVYFSADGRTFSTVDMRVPVTCKSSGPDRPLCYCFGYSEAMIRAKIAATGATAVPDHIRAAIRAGHCACEIRNPQGSCCLANVMAAVKAAGNKDV
ncbi:MAG: hypothetical protein D6781_11720 [Verrucomicrobia bacterium]|nr:MAG: hypothetical protein D6781_11720 [Verrucomicrobiota bacterium]